MLIEYFDSLETINMLYDYYKKQNEDIDDMHERIKKGLQDITKLYSNLNWQHSK